MTRRLLAALVMVTATLGRVEASHFFQVTSGETIVDRFFKPLVSEPKKFKWRFVRGSNSALDYGALRLEVERAMREWEIAGTNIQFEFTGESQTPEGPKNDGLNSILWGTFEPIVGPDGKPATIQGLTFFSGNPSSELLNVSPELAPIRDVDIVLNETNSLFKDSKHFSMIVLHELGHALGFRHSATEVSPMYPIPSREVAGFGASANEIAWAQKMYPDSAFVPLGSISGRAIDPATGGGFPGVFVMAVSIDQPFEFRDLKLTAGVSVSTFTDPDGRFVIPNLPDGRYILQLYDVAAVGFSLGTNYSQVLSAAQATLSSEVGTQTFFTPDFYQTDDCAHEDPASYETADPVTIKDRQGVTDLIVIANVDPNYTSGNLCASDLLAASSGGGCAVSIGSPTNSGLLVLALLLMIAVRRKEANSPSSRSGS